MPELSFEDKKSFTEIYKRVEIIGITPTGLQQMEKLIDESIKIAEKYGTGTTPNLLLKYLLEIKRNELKTAKTSAKGTFESDFKQLQTNFKMDIHQYAL